MQKVTVEIRNGTPKVIVQGVKGPGCKAITKDLEEELGEVVETTKTHEYNHAGATATKGKTLGH